MPDVIYVAKSKFAFLLCVGAGCMNLFGHGTVVFLVLLLLRRSPIMIPYHVFGGKHELIKLERDHSLAYWSVLGLECGIFTVTTLTLYCFSVICIEVFMRIFLISRAMR